MSESELKKLKTTTEDAETQDPKLVVIGTRKSMLAMWQANFVCDALTKAHPSLKFEVRGLSTTGDDNQMKPLRAFEARGIFTKELDIALLNSEIDLAVHCVKDLPTLLPPGLLLSAILPRGNREDVLVLHAKHKGKSLDELPEGAVIGTSALRRMAGIAHKYGAKYVCKDVRGNLQTRLMKLDRGDYDALILAKIGLERMELHDRISEVLDPELFGYAVGQGALGIAAREGDSRIEAVLEGMRDRACTIECRCERGLLRKLEGGCKVPIAVRSSFTPSSPSTKGEGKLQLWACVSSLDGTKRVEFQDSVELGDGDDGEVKLGHAVGEKLLEQGAAEILKVAKAAATEDPQKPPVAGK